MSIEHDFEEVDELRGPLNRQNGSIELLLEGSSPQGEEDAISTCKVLVERLRLDGARWADLREGTPEGQRFVMIRNPVRSAGDLVYVEHWFPALLASMQT